MSDLTPNLPEIVEEVRVLFEAYETALVEKDVAVLDATFWESPHTIRYGVVLTRSLTDFTRNSSSFSLPTATRLKVAMRWNPAATFCS